MNKRLLTALTASLLMVGATPVHAQVAAPGAATERYALTISDALRRFESLETMRVAVNTSPGLGVLLSSQGIYTLFAPTNDAFSKITQTQLNRMVSGRASLGHYVVRGALTREVLMEMLLARGGQMTLPTVGGAPLAFALDGQNNIIVGGVARLLGQPEVVGNGVIYPISAVVTAPRAAGGLSDTPFVGAVGGIGEQIGGIGAGLRQAVGALETGDVEAARGFLGEVEAGVGEALGGLGEEQRAGALGVGLTELQTGLGELGGINEIGALRQRVGGLYQGFTQRFGAGVGAAEGGGLTTGRTISDALRIIEPLQTFRAAVNASPRIGRILSTPGMYSLFAPTNDAFSVITQQQLNAIVSGNSDIGHYVVEGTVTPEILRQMLLARGGQMSLPTISGGNLALTLDREGTGIVVGGVARLLGAEVYGNGVILPISNVVTAPTGAGFAGGGIAAQGVGADVGAAAGVGAEADLGAVGGAGAGAIGALIEPIYTGLTRTREALAAEDIEAARGYFGEARGALETALGRAEGETLTALQDIERRFGELGGITDVREREALLIELERDVQELY